MPAQPSRGLRWLFRLAFLALTALGVWLLVDAIRSPDADPGQWVAAIVILAITLPVLLAYVRIRGTPRHEREARVAQLQTRLDERGPGPRSASRRFKRPILEGGIDGTAVIRAIRDAGMGSTASWVVYLELEVSTSRRSGYVVEVAESVRRAAAGTVFPGNELVVKVDPIDHDLVAVDWEASLRLR